ncbi:MAG: hypothetical protein OEL78_00010 [Hyphomicrobiales bacterium]|nr:hypothetical protein [Hyphomicrobiales bacterium]
MAQMRLEEIWQKAAFLARDVPTSPVSVQQMPHPKKSLPKCEWLMLRFWISQGAGNDRRKCYLRKIQ